MAATPQVEPFAVAVIQSGAEVDLQHLDTAEQLGVPSRAEGHFRRGDVEALEEAALNAST